MTDASRSQRAGWLRFRLRTLLIAVTCVASLLGFAVHRINEGRQQGRVAEQLRQLGCSVRFSPPKRLQPGSYLTVMAPPGALPAWLEGTPLADALHRITDVTIHGRSEHDLNLVLDQLVQLDEIPTLLVRRRGFSTEHLERLTTSVRVGSLNIATTSIGRGRLPCLDRNGLTSLCVAHTQFSGPAVADLPASLEYLNATRTRVNDGALPHFARLTRLKKLKLQRTPTTAVAIEELRQQMPWCEIEWERLVHP